jgi:hypothetical protein
VEWAKKGMALLAVFIWTFAGMHCKLEKISGFAFLDCPTDSRGSENCNGDGCEVVEGAFCKAPSQAKVLPAPLLLNHFNLLCAGDLPPQILVPFHEPALSLAVSWHFDQLAAAIPRAPSFCS